MATPIKETPILLGKDAVRFITNVQKNENNVEHHKTSAARALKVFKAVKAAETETAH